MDFSFLGSAVLAASKAAFSSISYFPSSPEPSGSSVPDFFFCMTMNNTPTIPETSPQICRTVGIFWYTMAVIIVTTTVFWFSIAYIGPPSPQARPFPSAMTPTVMQMMSRLPEIRSQVL